VIATAILISAPSFLAKLKQVAVLSLTLAMFFAIFLTYLYQWRKDINQKADHGG
jgi:hypothetical protein